MYEIVSLAHLLVIFNLIISYYGVTETAKKKLKTPWIWNCTKSQFLERKLRGCRKKCWWRGSVTTAWRRTSKLVPVLSPISPSMTRFVSFRPLLLANSQSLPHCFSICKDRNISNFLRPVCLQLRKFATLIRYIIHY